MLINSLEAVTPLEAHECRNDYSLRNLLDGFDEELERKDRIHTSGILVRGKTDVKLGFNNGSCEDIRKNIE